MPLMLITWLGVGLVPGLGQAQPSKYQPGTIIEVKAHEPSAGKAASDNRYDISVKVGNTVYVALYTRPPGRIAPQYRIGLSLLVLIENNTLTFNDRLGRSQKLPILSQKTAPENKYQSGRIMAVKAHDPSAGEPPSDHRYDIYVRVGNTMYVVLYTLPPGATAPKYYAGLSLLVSVNGSTLMFNDTVGRPQEVPILSRRTVPESGGHMAPQRGGRQVLRVRFPIGGYDEPDLFDLTTEAGSRILWGRL